MALPPRRKRPAGGRDARRPGRRGPSARRGSAPSLPATPRADTERTESGQQERLDELTHDLQVATQIQSNLLPKKIPRIEGFDLSAYYRPSKEVGGDYYDFIDLSEGRMALVIADVSGKGVAGSMVMTMFRTMLRSHAPASHRSTDPLIATNRQMSQDIKRGMFVTCMYIVLEPATATLRISSAGHNPLVYWRKKTNRCHLINPRGIAIGFDAGPVFERSLHEQMFKLEPGDRVVAYTDGIVEAMDPDNQEFGNERFLALISQHAEASSGRFVNLMVEAVTAFAGAAPQSDDITILSLRYTGAGTTGSTVLPKVPE